MVNHHHRPSEWKGKVVKSFPVSMDLRVRAEETCGRYSMSILPLIQLVNGPGHECNGTQWTSQMELNVELKEAQSNSAHMLKKTGQSRAQELTAAKSSESPSSVDTPNSPDTTELPD